MKPVFVVVFLLLFAAGSSAQFAVVQDADGFVNVRSSAKTGNTVSGTLVNGHLVYANETTGNWTQITYEKAGVRKSGFVYTNRLVFLSGFEPIPITERRKNEVQLLKRDIEIAVLQQPFDSAKHRYHFWHGMIAKIDGEDVLGTDGDLPKTEYKSVTVHTGGKAAVLPATALKNLFNPNIEYTEGYYNKAGNTLYIQASNSDGSAGYLVVWKIVAGKYQERFVNYGP